MNKKKRIWKKSTVHLPIISIANPSGCCYHYQTRTYTCTSFLALLQVRLMQKGTIVPVDEGTCGLRRHHILIDSQLECRMVVASRQHLLLIKVLVVHMPKWMTTITQELKRYGELRHETHDSSWMVDHNSTQRMRSKPYTSRWDRSRRTGGEAFRRGGPLCIRDPHYGIRNLK